MRALNNPTRGSSGARTFNTVQEIIRHHRIQASPGFRNAANACAAQLRAAAVATEILRFPANFSTHYWTSGQFQEWDCRAATLEFIALAAQTRTLADYSEHILALVQRSNGTPEAGIEAEIVLLENGETEGEYADRDVRGNIVSTGGDAARIHALAVERHVTLGLITDRIAALPGLRDRHDLLDALQYTSF